jgi:hypothetical protein
MKKVACLISLCTLLTLSAFRMDTTPGRRPVSAGAATTAAVEPVKLSWETLRDVTFKKKWYPEESVYMLYPTFGPGIQRLNGKPVELTGYVLPVDIE